MGASTESREGETSALRRLNPSLHPPHNQRIVEVIGGGHGARTPIAGMGQQAVDKTVFALVRLRIGKSGAAQQRQPHHVALNIVAVFAIIEQADTIIAFAQVDPFVGTAFKACPIPGGIAMGGALYIAPLHIKGGGRRKHINRKSYLEQQMAFVPINPGIEVEAALAADKDRRAVPSRSAPQRR